MSEWISVREKDAPAFETVILYVGGEVMVGWNESIQPDEEAAYVSWEAFPESCLDGDVVTHWMRLPKGPNE